MMINTYDDNEMIKRDIWATIRQASCVMSFKPRHDYAAFDSIFIACGNLLDVK